MFDRSGRSKFRSASLTVNDQLLRHVSIRRNDWASSKNDHCAHPKEEICRVETANYLRPVRRLSKVDSAQSRIKNVFLHLAAAEDSGQVLYGTHEL